MKKRPLFFCIFALCVIILVVSLIIIAANNTSSDNDDMNALHLPGNMSEDSTPTEELKMDSTNVEYYDGGTLPFLIEGLPEGHEVDLAGQLSFTNEGCHIRIPRYDHFDLLFERRHTTNGEFVTELSYHHLQARLVLGRDGYVSPFISMGDSLAGRLLALAPTTAARDLQDDTGCGYLMYQTTEGARLFIFLLTKQASDMMPLQYGGYPILMRKALTYADFSTIGIGSTASEILSIDPVMQDYIRQFNSTCDYEKSLPLLPMGDNIAQLEFVSAHLLTDGILKFDYDLIGGEYTVSKVEFSPDFIIDGRFADLGGSYKILAEDYN
ncbi:MAG: hypothetical protein FWH17_06140 [Oscillospiraceae bacterium]|nr:hypothetical protein [Oscillospiraceae bacterium]